MVADEAAQLNAVLAYRGMPALDVEEVDLVILALQAGMLEIFIYLFGLFYPRRLYFHLPPVLIGLNFLQFLQGLFLVLKVLFVQILLQCLLLLLGYFGHYDVGLLLNNLFVIGVHLNEVAKVVHCDVEVFEQGILGVEAQTDKIFFHFLLFIL